MISLVLGPLVVVSLLVILHRQRDEQIPYDKFFATLSSRLPLSGAVVEKNEWRLLTVFLDLELSRLRRVYT